MVLAARWRESVDRHEAEAVAVTIDHGLRPESKREAAAWRGWRASSGSRTARCAGRGKKPETGLQQAARAARYRLLAEAARDGGRAHVLTAHTRDDQAETVLIRMSRGSGLTGLAAMQRMSAFRCASAASDPGIHST